MTSVAIRRAEPFLVPSAVRSPQREGGDAAGGAEAASAASEIVKCHQPSQLSAFGEKALVGQETWWHQSYLKCCGQQFWAC